MDLGPISSRGNCIFSNKKKRWPGLIVAATLSSAALIVGGSVISSQTLGYGLNWDENVFRGDHPPPLCEAARLCSNEREDELILVLISETMARLARLQMESIMAALMKGEMTFPFCDGAR